MAKRTIQRHIRAVPPPGDGQQWCVSLNNHRAWACDFLQVYDVWFRPIFAFFIVDVNTKEVVHVAVTRQPSERWTSQQLRNATTFCAGPAFIIRGGVGRWRGGFRSRGVAVYRRLSPLRRCLIPLRSSVSRHPLIEPCVRISRTRLSPETSRHRARPVAFRILRRIQSHLLKSRKRKLARCRPPPLVFHHQPPAEPPEQVPCDLSVRRMDSTLVEVVTPPTHDTVYRLDSDLDAHRRPCPRRLVAYPVLATPLVRCVTRLCDNHDADFLGLGTRRSVYRWRNRRQGE